jgi:tRNA (mo5U34)-methyltransferase
VLATDYFCWGHGGWGSKRAFELARRALDSHVEDLDIDPLDLTPDSVGTFDVVLFLGVLYHMRHPLLALERVASVTRGQLILQTQVDLLTVPRPAMAFYEGPECNGDPTNWSGPNPPALLAMLRTAGFREISIVDQSFPDDPTTFASLPAGQHMTVHAWK